MSDPITIGLSDARLTRVAAPLRQLVRPGIRCLTAASELQDLGLGASRIGGLPDVSPNFTWPTWEEEPLGFLAQINLADLASFPVAEILPSVGSLLFFYDLEQSTWGFDPEDRGSWAVIYQPDTALARAEFPDPGRAEELYAPCTLNFASTLTLPPIDAAGIEQLHLTDSEREAYWELWAQFESQSEGHHQLLGYPLAIQGDMQLECQFAANGLYCGDGSAYTDPKAATLRSGASAWEFLLQLDSDENATMMWGDLGRLYFWCQAADIQQGNFDQAWMILQCS